MLISVAKLIALEWPSEKAQSSSCCLKQDRIAQRYLHRIAQDVIYTDWTQDTGGQSKCHISSFQSFLGRLHLILSFSEGTNRPWLTLKSCSPCFALCHWIFSPQDAPTFLICLSVLTIFLSDQNSNLDERLKNWNYLLSYSQYCS